MGIKNKKVCILRVFTEKSDFQVWFTKIYIYEKFSKKGGLGQFTDVRWGLAKKGVVFLREIDTQMHFMRN